MTARDVAAYLLDRADQYDDGCFCWLALAEAARNIMAGEVEAAKRNGDFDAALYARVDPKGIGIPRAPSPRRTR